jgi:hypothetical protein
MSVHKLTAGSGYDYLTRQVAALDATDKGRTGLASYYTERGESPGVWVGSGMEGIDGLGVGDPVTAEQMRALFGCGLHPLAELRLQQWEGPALTGQDFRHVMRLGAPFKIMDEATPFRVEVAKRIAALNALIGEPVDASVTGAAVLLAAALVSDEPIVLPRRPETWAAMAYLVVIGWVVVFLLYLIVLRYWTASRASYGFVIIPFVTIVLSAWLDNEPVGVGLVLGGLLVLAGSMSEHSVPPESLQRLRMRNLTWADPQAAK